MRRRRSVLAARLGARLRLRLGLRRRRIVSFLTAAILTVAILVVARIWLRHVDSPRLCGDDRGSRIITAAVVAESVVLIVVIAIPAIIVAIVVIPVARIALGRGICVSRAAWVCLTNVIAADLVVPIGVATHILRRVLILDLVSVTAILVVVCRVVNESRGRAHVAVVCR